MRTPTPLSMELEALLAPHRAPLPLPPSVVSRVIARAAAAEPPGYLGARRFIRPWWVFAAATGVVLVLGAGAYAARAWIGERPSEVVPAAVEPSPWRVTRARRPVVGADLARTEPPVTAAPEGQPRRHSPGRASNTGAPTFAELRLLRAARQEVTLGDYAGALAILGEHSRRFGNGTLVEEREALRIKSLAGIGRHKEAQAAALAFRARFPRSVFLSTFEHMKEADR